VAAYRQPLLCYHGDAAVAYATGKLRGRLAQEKES
jgi:hypothetical protein